MAKEMIIIFVYDTQFKSESDDLSSAILYFHPHWVSGQQRTALCGQIMGTFHCLKSLFASPNIISLQSGKFFILEYGSYILAIGTDRNIDDWVLEYRAETMSSLIELFHNNLEWMANNCQKDVFTAKLYHMLETYMKILIYSGNIFYHIPTLQLPKSASNVYLEAIEILQTCQGAGHVLGGVILYHNKIVATQLRSNLTKKLVLTDPYRIKSPAETVNVAYQLPLGVQLLKIYVRASEYEELLNDADDCRNISKLCKSKLQQAQPGKIKDNKETTVLLSAMKRDQSLIFTTVPEEETDNQSPVNIQNVAVQPKPLNRPKFLNLRNKTTDSRMAETTMAAPAVIEAKPVPITPFHGQTSVCSTPMTDLNKVLHQKVMSICLDPQEPTKLPANEKETDVVSKTGSLNSILSAISETSDASSHNKESVIFESVPYMKMSVSNAAMKPSKSSLDLTLDDEPIVGTPRRRSQSVHDPTFPVTATNEACVSRHLYGTKMREHVASLKQEARGDALLPPMTDGGGASESNTEEWKSLEDIDEVPCTKIETNQTDSIAMRHRKRSSLTLPLKPLDADVTASTPPAVAFNQRHSFGGVQLTPLMTKLSLLANEERSSGFCSVATTPSAECKDYGSFITSTTKVAANATTNDRADLSDRKDLKSATLFVCGQQDTVAILVMTEDGCHDEAVVQKLWDTCVECLGKIEKRLRQCLETCPANNSGQSGTTESYSYLCMNAEWDAVQRGGPWGATELGALTHMHRDFCDNALTEIVLRDDEGVIYGHQLGKHKVYYHQLISNGHCGLPTPADPMGTVPLKARRRLERDHAIVLL